MTVEEMIYAFAGAAITLSLIVTGGKVRKHLEQLRKALAEVDEMRAADPVTPVSHPDRLAEEA